MPWQDDGRQRPDRMAERFQRKDRGTIADGTSDDMAGDDDNGAGRYLRHDNNFQFRASNCNGAVDDPFRATLSTALHKLMKTSVE
jgi:hypothetical protein